MKRSKIFGGGKKKKKKKERGKRKGKGGSSPGWDNGDIRYTRILETVARDFRRGQRQWSSGREPIFVFHVLSNLPSTLLHACQKSLNVGPFLQFLTNDAASFSLLVLGAANEINRLVPFLVDLTSLKYVVKSFTIFSIFIF